MSQKSISPTMRVALLATVLVMTALLLLWSAKSDEEKFDMSTINATEAEADEELSYESTNHLPPRHGVAGDD